ncbi:glycosyltransferase family 4 protein [Hyphobacterium sp. CCMP332]|nr:glycosyltransferase family 4 protein [Hyphobacterium sp. CCMP332]
MRLAVHYHIPCFEENGKIFTDAQQGVFLDSIAVHFEIILCFLHSPLAHEMKNMDYEILSKNIKVIGLGPHLSFPKRLMRVMHYLKTFKRYEGQFDAILCRTPSPLSNFIIKRFPKKSAIYVVGDYIDGLSSMKGNWLKKQLIKLWAHYYENLQNKLASDILCITNSRLKQNKLLKFNGKTQLIRSTTLKKADFYDREDTCQGDVIKILYTGRIDEAKGLEDILEAILKIINSDNKKIEFHIAGFSLTKRNDLIDKLKGEAAKQGNEGIVQWHGKLKIGSELNELYRSCDIYCIASRSGFEGFPRTIWEAMANSLPVIASEVGSIPYFMDNYRHGILSIPKSVESLVKSINEIIDKEELRKNMIKNARELAKDNTLDQFGVKISGEIKSYFNT